MPTSTPYGGTFVGPKPPSEVGSATLWISTALADQRFPAHPGETYVAVDTVSTPTQEPNAFEYNGTIYLLVNTSGALVLYTSTSTKGPWVSRGTVMGGGVGGESLSVIHPSLFVEGTTVYIYYITSSGATAVKVASATMAALAATPTSAFGGQATVITKSSTVLPGLSQVGNFSCIYARGQYHLYIEATYTSGESWQTVRATCATPTGTFVVQAGIVATLQPRLLHQRSSQQPPPTPVSFVLDGFRSYASCGPIEEVDGVFTMLYHGFVFGIGDLSPTSEIYRATSTDLDNWTVDLWGWPVYGRLDTRWECDQVADIFPLKLSSGLWIAFWAANHNPSNRFVVKAAMLSPTMRMYDGFGGWVDLDQQADTSKPRGLQPRGRYAITGHPIFPFDDVPVDPGNTAGFVVQLPAPFYGCEVGVTHIGTGTGTIQVTTPIGQFAVNGTTSDATTISKGQRVIYKCYGYTGSTPLWARQG